jgi:hypothetical protein
LGEQLAAKLPLKHSSRKVKKKKERKKEGVSKHLTNAGDYATTRLCYGHHKIQKPTA